MKVIVGVLASHNEIYDKFKELWIKNINGIDHQKRKQFSFYFIYGNETGEENRIIRGENWVDLYYDFQETIPNMLRKSCKFFEYVNEKYNNEEYIILRTNLSTLFDFKKLLKWVNEVPNRMFFGGSLIDGYSGNLTRISGINMIFTKDIMRFLIDNQDRFIYNQNEDVVLSSVILMNLYKNLTLRTIKRLDFIEETVMYHRCSTNTELDDFFCYRFKSKDRKKDITNMKKIIENGCLVNMGDFRESIILSEGEVFQIFADKFWKVSDDGRPFIYDS